MNRGHRVHKRGFTLLELIIALIVVAIFGAIIFQYLGTALTSSFEPLENLGKSHQLERAMDNMILYFEDRKSRGTLDMNAFKSAIGNETNDMDNQFGKYTVVKNAYIQFNASLQEVGDSYGTFPDDILKVIIKNDLNQQVTMLFVR